MTTTLALAGNPNCGKTTIFNALTGSHQHVGNWPGVTVERRSGFFQGPDGPVEVVDLPGTYSLSAQSEDERIAAGFVADPSVDVIVNVLDASNLERNLYLTTQLLELRRPIVFALNMMDDAEKKGMRIDLATLERLLGGPVIATVGNREEGIQALREAVLRCARAPYREPAPGAGVNYGHDLDQELQRIEREIRRDEQLAQACPPRWLALRLLERSPDALRQVERSHARQAITTQVQASLDFLEPHLGADGATLVAERRYGFNHGLVGEVLQQAARSRTDFTSRLDAVLTHRWLGIPLFIAIMIAVYTLTFVLGKVPQDWIAGGFNLLHGWAGAHLPPGELSSLLVDGIIPGVGAVVVFVPVIMILMGCIAFLEDTGYMSRAAFIMDRLMHLMGLHGKSFIPLIMGTGCNVPAVQATRTIESRTDRFITILVAPLMSCSARLQIYIVLAGTFFPPVQAALAILAMHFLGFALAMVVGKLLRLTLFRGTAAPFVMELPPYRLPVLKSTLIHMWEKGSVFLTRAGTTILVGATLVWFLSHYPGIANRSWSEELHRQEAAVRALALPPAEEASRLDDLALAHQSRVVNTSLAASIGKTLQPALAPILDPDRSRPEAWKDSIALTAGFVAKEIVVSTMAVIHHSEASGDGEGGLQHALRTRSGLTPLTALAFMVFILIYTPCLGTVGMILKETRSLLWTGFSLTYGLGLAWLMAWFTILGGQALGLGVS
ncbi:MAG: ferrous iron transport protein B [Holophaga sp.]|nr:ferrous iron transport protein B [Holophaga sp.]